MFISYSQNFEDVILYRALRKIDNGFYIDVGAGDPVVDSVTKAFYERGWRGINIEPSRIYYEKLMADRPRDINLSVVASNKKGLVNFYEILETGYSTTKKIMAEHFARKGYKVREYQVACLPLAEICAANHVEEIHFLKIDVEGMEMEVVEGFDFKVWRPWIVLIEAIDPITQEPVDPVWETVLFQHNYEFVYYDGLNRFYLARERSDLKEAFATPPGVFDSFIRYNEWLAKQEKQKLQTQLTYLDQQVQMLEGQLAEVQARAEAERAALQEQVAELHKRLQAVYASTSWRVTAPLRAIKRASVKVIGGFARSRKTLAALWPFVAGLALQFLRKLARWAAQDPRLRSLGKKLLSQSPALRARVRRLILQEPPASIELGPQCLPKVEQLELPESAWIVFEELRKAVAQSASQKQS